MSSNAIQGIEAMLKMLEKLGVDPLESLAKAGRDAMKERIETRTKIKCPVNTGHLRASYMTEIVEMSDDEVIVVTGSNLTYAPHVEYGTGPHMTDAGSDNFVADITQWAERKGLNPVDVIRSIRKHGTKAHPHLRPAWDEGKDKVITDIATKMKQVIKGFGK